MILVSVLSIGDTSSHFFCGLKEKWKPGTPDESFPEFDPFITCILLVKKKREDFKKIFIIILFNIIIIMRCVSLPVDPGSSSLRFPLGVRGVTR